MNVKITLNSSVRVITDGSMLFALYGNSEKVVIAEWYSAAVYWRYLRYGDLRSLIMNLPRPQSLLLKSFYIDLHNKFMS